VDKPDLWLGADCLTSKWGFNDGDLPEPFMDYWDEVGVDYVPMDWKATLRKLVRDHLVPALEAAGHELTVSDRSSHHNPIRADVIDGVDIQATTNNIDSPVPLRVEGVTVPYDEVMRAVVYET
jgi:hypothetical protein